MRGSVGMRRRGMRMLMAVSAAGAAGSAHGGVTDVEIHAHVYKPAAVAPTPDRLAQLSLPPGFEVAPFARDVSGARMLAIGPDDRVLVTQREQGQVLALRDDDGDGVADGREVVARLPAVHGIAVDGRQVYLATVDTVYRLTVDAQGVFGAPAPVQTDLPDGGQHANRTVAIGPDGALYVTIGSTCNACRETDVESATMLRAMPPDGEREVFASGLRNTLGFDWSPASGELYGFDHGIDWLGDDAQPEEFNRLVPGERYGWPYVYADGQLNPQDEPPEVTAQAWAAQSVAPVLTYQAHAAPMQMQFYRGKQFPAAYRGDAFVALRGSWNRKPPSGYEIARVIFDDAGQPQRIEPFLTGLLQAQPDGSWSHIGRPVGLVFLPDGSMLFGDDINGVIYRVSYQESER